MAIIKFNNVGIRAISACVPRNVQRNIDLARFFQEKAIQEIIDTTGIKEKRVASENLCASDLCFEAAKTLFDELGIDKNTIDILIFFSQSNDYKIPATAPSLQHRLNLPKKTGSFDMGLACSGYVYALSAAFAFASQEGVNKVLLLDGETFSKLINIKDKTNSPIYGDAGTATLIEKGDFGISVFSLNSDGSGVDALKIEAGGARTPSNTNNISEMMMEDGNIRSPHQLFMDGMEVFNFTMLNVPKDITAILNITGNTPETIDLLVLHQANKFMTDYFIKRLKFPGEKVPYSLDRFGNTSSASIPLTLVSETKFKKKDNVVLAGFGAGLSWATANLSLKDCRICELTEI